MHVHIQIMKEVRRHVKLKPTTVICIHCQAKLHRIDQLQEQLKVCIRYFKLTKMS